MLRAFVLGWWVGFGATISAVNFRSGIHIVLASGCVWGGGDWAQGLRGTATSHGEPPEALNAKPVAGQDVHGHFRKCC